MKALKKEIEAKGIKQKWIAEQIKVSHPLLSMYLSGKRNMPKNIELSIRAILQ